MNASFGNWAVPVPPPSFDLSLSKEIFFILLFVLFILFLNVLQNGFWYAILICTDIEINLDRL